MITLNFNPFPVLKSENYGFRETTLPDIDTLFELRSNATVMKYVARPMAKTKDDVRPVFKMMQDNIKNNVAIPWWIESKITQQTLGQIGFHRIDKENYSAEIGYYILPQFEGKGVVTEAIKTIINFGFTNLQLNSVEAKVDPRNVGSAKVLLKNGFVQEAHFREDCCFEGKFLDTLVSVLLKSDWENMYK